MGRADDSSLCTVFWHAEFFALSCLDLFTWWLQIIFPISSNITYHVRNRTGFVSTWEEEGSCRGSGGQTCVSYRNCHSILNYYPICLIDPDRMIILTWIDSQFTHTCSNNTKSSNLGTLQTDSGMFTLHSESSSHPFVDRSWFNAEFILQWSASTLCLVCRDVVKRSSVRCLPEQVIHWNWSLATLGNHKESFYKCMVNVSVNTHC